MNNNKYYSYQKAEEKRIQSLRENKLFFSYPSAFNDPYDSDFTVTDDLEGSKSIQGYDVSELKIFFKQYYEGGLDGKWDSYMLSFDIAKTIHKWCIGEKTSNDLKCAIEKHLKDVVGVKCFFPDEPSSVLMWAHYANNHTGFCVEYTEDNLAESINQNNNKKIDVPRDVVYLTDKHDFYLSEFLFSSRLFIDRILKAKASVWAYEKEVRICLLNTSKGEEVDKKGFSLPLSDSRMKVSALYLGLWVEGEGREMLIDTAKKMNVPIYKCEKHDYDISLFELVKID